MKVAEKTNKGIFSSTWSKELQVTFSYDPADLSFFLHQLLTSILPKDLFSKTSITDLKGRDKLHLLLNNFKEEEKPTDDELLYVHCTNHLSPEEAPLTYRVNSKFQSFIGDHHIEHSLSDEIQNAPFHPTNPTLLGFIAPYEIQSLRVGLETFQSKSSGLFSYAPTVNEQLLIECKDGEGICLIHSDALKKKEATPFKFKGIGEKVLGSLNSTMKSSENN